MAAIQPAGPYTDQVIPPYLWPIAHEAAVRAAADYSVGRAESEAAADSYQAAANQLSATSEGVKSEGATSEALINVHRYLAIDHRHHHDIRESIAKTAKRAADRGYALTNRLQTIDRWAHEDIAAATPAEREGIIARFRALAVSAHAEATADVVRYHGEAAEAAAPLVAGILSRTAPAAPPPVPAPTETRESGPGGAEKRGEKSLDRTDDTTPPEGAGAEQRGKRALGQDGGTSQPEPTGAERRAPLDGGSAPLPVGAVAGSGGGSAGGLGGGGLSSAGGLGGGPMAGGGGLSGLSSGSPLSGLGSAAAQTTAGPAPGLGGLPTGAPAAGVQPGQLGPAATGFSQGVSAGSAAAPAVGPLPPATTTGTPVQASAAGNSPAAPAAGVSGSVAGAPSAGVAAAGAQAPAAAGSGGAAAGTSGAPAAMMLPSPGMGAPPAAPGGAASASAGAAVTPAAASAATAGAGSSIGSAGSAPGSGGPMLVPGSVVSPAAGAGRGRLESAELAAATALARKLRRDSDAVLYAWVDWAVGVFRGEASGATDCVVVSTEGFGYVPWGVFLPRSARTLAADELVDNGFRERWFSPADPAQVLVEYARLRKDSDVRLAAIAVTDDKFAVRMPGVESAVCRRTLEPGVLPRPVLDELHQHRLETAHPAIYGRVKRLADSEMHTREVWNQIVEGTAAQAMAAVTSAGIRGLDVPGELRQMWEATGPAGAASSPELWEKYQLAALATAVRASAGRPGSDGDTGQRELYGGQWRIARAMEMVWGFSPEAQNWQRDSGAAVWADMLYSAAATFDGDTAFLAAVEPLLRQVEAGRGA